MLSGKRLIFCTLILLNFISCQNEEFTSQVEASVKSSNVIIGQDDRREAAGRLDINFIRKSGQLRTEIKIENSSSSHIISCSGALIGSSHIITAAHCAFHRDSNELLTNTYFYPGKTEANKAEYDRYPVVKVYYPKSYDNESIDPAKDIAIMELGKSASGKEAGDRVGFFGYWGRDQLPSGETLTIGYPGDKPDSKQHFENGCKVEESLSNALYVYCDVISGQSGSPILIYSEEYKNFYIHGVINSSSKYRQENYGSLLSNERGDIVRSIKEGNFQIENEFYEKWISKSISHDRLVRVLMENKCKRRDSLVAYRYKNPNTNSWESKGFYSLRPGETHEVFTSKNGIFYVHARDHNRNIIISGDKSYEVPNSSGYFNFGKYQTKKWGDFKVEIPCY